MKKVTIISILLALYLMAIPASSYAMTWKTPSGAIVDESGHIVAFPPSFTVKVATTTRSTITSSCFVDRGTLKKHCSRGG